jgi:ribose transport system substrate-binding protein
MFSGGRAFSHFFLHTTIDNTSTRIDNIPHLTHSSQLGGKNMGRTKGFAVSSLLVFLFLILLPVTLFARGGTEGTGGAQRFANVQFAVVPKSLDNPVFTATKAGATQAAEELGIHLIYTAPVADEAAQAAQIVEQLVNKGVNGIAVSCSSAQAMSPVIKEAYERGIPIITWDSDAPGSKRSIYYGSPNYDIGQLVAENLAKALNGKGKVAIFQVAIGNPNLDERYKGMMDTFAKSPDIQVVQRFTATAMEIGLSVDAVNTYIAAHPEVAGLATTTGFPWWGSKGSLPAVEKRISEGTLKCVGVDPLPAALDYVDRGVLSAIVGQRFYQMGYGSIRLLAALYLNPSLNEYLTAHPADLSSGLDLITKNGTDNSISVSAYKKMLDEWAKAK